MSACEKCWSDAFVISRTLGGSQVDEYRKLIKQREENGHICTPGEQLGDRGSFAGRELRDARSLVEDGFA